MSAAAAGNDAAHEAYWSAQLFACLEEFASLKTNAVLLTLAGSHRLERGRRYPEGGLEFAGHRWRAFYHCHPADSRHPDEHGHFHIFSAGAGQAWAHVAGLGIDACGQPLQWFAVNRWVTDGPWLERAELPARLQAARLQRHDPAVGRWLLALLQLYRSSLSGLLRRRDAQLCRQAGNRDRDALLEDRAIYTLATQPLDLQSMLEERLVHGAGKTRRARERG